MTLRAVARRVGITPPSIHRHFADPATVMLVVIQRGFEELDSIPDAALDAAPGDPRSRLFTICSTYLEFADRYPGRYRTMFGGIWKRELRSSSVTQHDLHAIGQASKELLADAVGRCAAAGISTSTDPWADSAALWMGLHGLAHQRSAVTGNYWWPPDIAERLVVSLARLTEDRGPPPGRSRRVAIDGPLRVCGGRCRRYGSGPVGESGVQSVAGPDAQRRVLPRGASTPRVALIPARSRRRRGSVRPGC
ncbi:TetR/AcrR family transcriptional regulator [Nocardiopsis mangrovi]|uniref:TetR/AcrR family transcriptional regulator n=1 Tax=Nocardiopsis mangrovi TaxID=1179818 RepID=A0ABV9DRE0_9ACTN